MLDEAFAQADLDTGLIERRQDSLFPPAKQIADSTLALAIAALLANHGQSHSTAQQNKVHADPWAQADGWRITGQYRQAFNLLGPDDTLHEASIERDGADRKSTRLNSSH